jgi:hypothetical protein
MLATGASLKERLLALDDGNSLLVGEETWVSLGVHGFEVSGELHGDVRHVGCADLDHFIGDGVVYVVTV